MSFISFLGYHPTFRLHLCKGRSLDSHWIPKGTTCMAASKGPSHFISPQLCTHTHAHTDLFTTVTCLCMGISLGGPLPAAEGKADRALSTTGFTLPHATSLPRGRRGTGLLLPSSGMLKDRGCRKVPLGFPKEFADAAMRSILLHPVYLHLPRHLLYCHPKGFFSTLACGHLNSHHTAEVTK